MKVLNVSPSDIALVEQSTEHRVAIHATSRPGSKDDASKINAEARSRGLSGRGAAINAAAAAAPNAGGPRYPGDLQFNGGETIHYTQHHAVYVNPTGACPPSTCFGNPERFLRDLGKSDFIHVVDQYTGDHADNRYTVGDSFVVNYPTTPGTPLSGLDMLLIAYAVEQVTGSGYGHFVHIFLPPGQDQCQAAGICYSPDNFATWRYCAYHGSFNSNIGHTIYSVEPYQNVSGCNVSPDTPNGQLTDSTNSVLSHEAIEGITDPDLDAWWNTLNNGMFGEEIADECSFLIFTATDVFFDPSRVRLNGRRYAIQPEYSNKAHACTTE